MHTSPHLDFCGYLYSEPDFKTQKPLQQSRSKGLTTADSDQDRNALPTTFIQSLEPPQKAHDEPAVSESETPPCNGSNTTATGQSLNNLVSNNIHYEVPSSDQLQTMSLESIEISFTNNSSSSSSLFEETSSPISDTQLKDEDRGNSQNDLAFEDFDSLLEIVLMQERILGRSDSNSDEIVIHPSEDKEKETFLPPEDEELDQESKFNDPFLNDISALNDMDTFNDNFHLNYSEMDILETIFEESLSELEDYDNNDDRIKRLLKSKSYFATQDLNSIR